MRPITRRIFIETIESTFPGLKVEYGFSEAHAPEYWMAEIPTLGLLFTWHIRDFVWSAHYESDAPTFADLMENMRSSCGSS